MYKNGVKDYTKCGTLTLLHWLFSTTCWLANASNYNI